MEQQFDTPTPMTLYVELGKGSLDVTATETTRTTVTIAGDHADDVVIRHEGNQVAVVAPRQRTGFFGGGEPSLEIRVVVPEGSDLVTKTGSADQVTSGRFGLARVKSGSGDVQLDRFDGAVVVDTGSGSISVTESGADLRVKSGSGDVRAERVGGAVAVSTGSGDTALGTAEGPVVVKTGSGDLRLDAARGDVSFSSASGDLSVGSIARGSLTAKNASGDIRVGVPAGIPVWTDVSSMTGRIASDLQGAGRPGPEDDYIELRVTTLSGDITLRQQ